MTKAGGKELLKLPPEERLEIAEIWPGALDRLMATGRVVPAQLDLTELGPPSDRPLEITISEALAEQRRQG